MNWSQTKCRVNKPNAADTQTNKHTQAVTHIFVHKQSFKRFIPHKTCVTHTIYTTSQHSWQKSVPQTFQFLSLTSTNCHTVGRVNIGSTLRNWIQYVPCMTENPVKCIMSIDIWINPALLAGFHSVCSAFLTTAQRVSVIGHSWGLMSLFRKKNIQTYREKHLGINVFQGWCEWGLNCSINVTVNWTAAL